MLSGTLCVAGQEMVSDTLRLSVYFGQNISEFEPGYRGNGQRMEEFKEALSVYCEDEDAQVLDIIIRAAASPEGPTAYNQALSERRAIAIRDRLTSGSCLKNGMFKIMAVGEDWAGLKEQLAECDQPWAAQALDIVRNTPAQTAGSGRMVNDRKQKLQQLAGGKAWEYMNDKLFPDLRYAGGSVMAVVVHPAVPAPLPEPVSMVEPEPEPEPVPMPVEEPVKAQIAWQPGIYLYNNVALDALLIANLGVEFDLGRHFSIALPALYSGWDYFSETVKFRCLGIRPELRWWPGRHLFYIGAHGAVSYWNTAVNGQYRYHDTDGTTPLYGGGLDLGVRIPITSRLFADISAGGGYYALSYDIFINEANGRQAYARQSKNYIGPDFLQINLVYRINGKKR